MGEIGIPRNEFLYDIDFWEAQRIFRGYENRDRTLLWLLRLNAYYTRYVMRENNEGCKASDLITFPWETSPADDITEEDVASIVAEIEAINKNRKKPQT